MSGKKRGGGEGTISQLPDGSWWARLPREYGPDGKERRKAIYGKTQREVVQKLAAAKSTQQQGLPVASDRLTVKQHLEGWLRRMEPPVVKPSTYRSYEQNCRLYLIPGLGRIVLGKLTPAQVQAFLNAKRTSATRTGGAFSAAAVARMRAVLRQALADAETHGLVHRNVAKLAKPPKGATREAVALSKVQASRLLDAIEGDRLEALYRLTLVLGLRQGEALGLTWGAEGVDLDAGTLTVSRAMQRVKDATTGASALIHVGTKSATSRRTITLPDSLVALLREHRTRQREARLLAGPAWRGNEQGLVFTTRVGTPLDGPNVTKYFQRHLERAGLPHMRFHDLRHSAVTFMAASGEVPLEVARDIVGHSDARLTMNVYRHVLGEEREQAAAALDRFYAR